MRVTSRADNALRAVVHLARQSDDAQLKGEEIAEAIEAPGKYLEAVLNDLRVGGILRSQRGAAGGYRLARPADEVTAAEVIRASDGPLATVRGAPPEELEYPESLDALRDMWVALRASVRSVLEGVTIADLAGASLPTPVSGLARDPASWETTEQRIDRGHRGET